MDSLARFQYEGQLSLAARHIRKASTILLFANCAAASECLDELEALFLSELDRSAKGRQPMTLRTPLSVAGASSRPSSGRGSRSASTLKGLPEGSQPGIPGV